MTQEVKQRNSGIWGIRLDRFYQGKRHALTMSYDDGNEADRRLVEIFDRYGIKGTFHLNSGNIGMPGYITEDEIKTLYQGHEVAGHSVNHPYLERLTPEIRMREIWEDRKKLETLSGKMVSGFSYPFGTWDDQVVAALRSCGFVYSRTVRSTGRFDLPEDFMKWHPTCHHKENLMDMAGLFLERADMPFSNMLFYVWGHSYEFNRDDNWELIEQFCKKVGKKEDVWYASNGEIYAYLQAVKRLQFSADQSKVYNPSALEVWFSVDGETCSVMPGEYRNVSFRRWRT